MVDQLGHESVPRPVHDPAPLTVLHPLQGVVERQVHGELPDQVDAEAGAALELGRVGVGHLLRDVHPLQVPVRDDLADCALGGTCARGGRVEHDVGVLLKEGDAQETLLRNSLWRLQRLSWPHNILDLDLIENIGRT